MFTLDVLDCGHTPTPDSSIPPRKDCTTDKAQVADLLTLDRASAYLSSDSRTVTTWTGGLLGHVTYHNTSRAARKTFVRVTDVHGQHWAGQGPAESGTYVNLRRVK